MVRAITSLDCSMGLKTSKFATEQKDCFILTQQDLSNNQLEIQNVENIFESSKYLECGIYVFVTFKNA